MEEKFLKIIHKAEVNGFSFRDGSELNDVTYIDYGRFDASFTTIHEDEDGESVEENSSFVFNIYEVFFNHNFAKAFFGTQEECVNCGHVLKGSDWKDEECNFCGSSLESLDDSVESWQKHLPIMVLEKDIMSYLLKYV